MITPEFELSQDDTYVSIKIKVPYVKISKAEMISDEYNFTFYLKPYHLKLSFMQPLVGEDKIHSAIYDHNTFYITIQLEKKIQGE
jgi:protein SHQ1